jgi:hypothetical protein
MAAAETGLTKHELTELLKKLGELLDFDVRTEVEASESAWVDIVWFDKRLPPGEKSFKMRYAPVLPVVAFEVEWGTGLNAKHVKGSVSNLSNLSAQLGVIVIAQHNLVSLQKLPPHTERKAEELEDILHDRVYRWVYAEAQARGRIIVMFEREVIKWAETKGLTPSSVSAVPSSAVSQSASLR